MNFYDYISEFKNNYEDEFQVNQGSSVILIQGDRIIFSLVKPKFWKESNNIIRVDFSGIGGSIESGEDSLQCLDRELQEEINISIDDIDFANPSEIVIIKNDTVSTLSLDTVDNIVNPIYILQLELPLREDINDSTKTKSCLQLFVYLAEIRDSIEINISTEEDIPGLILVDGAKLEDILSGNVILNTDDITEGLEIRSNKNAIDLPPTIHLKPKFTPTGLIKADLKFEDLINMLGRNWNE